MNSELRTMLDTLQNNINAHMNRKHDICSEWEGCMFQDVCERNTVNCAITLEILGKPLPIACQKLIDEDKE